MQRSDFFVSKRSGDEAQIISLQRSEPALLVLAEKDRGSEAPSGAHEEKVGTASFGRLLHGSTSTCPSFIVGLLKRVGHVPETGAIGSLLDMLVSLGRAVDNSADLSHCQEFFARGQ